MSAKGKIVLVAPYWGSPGHVGYKRAERFARWITASGRELLIVRAGPRKEIHSLRPDLSLAAPDESGADSAGCAITVRDPLGLKVYAGGDAAPGPQVPQRTGGSWRSSLVCLVFNPDPTTAWAKQAARDPDVLSQCQGTEWVVSSSPPESCHLAAYWLAQSAGARLCVDMRDGWLDEPLKPLLERWAWRRWLEGRWESRVLRRAGQVFVTSEVWRELLNSRLPFTRGKTQVLTNAYPPGPHPAPSALGDRERLTLVHAGRLAGSRNTQSAGVLLAPLIESLGGPLKADVELIGSLNADDLSNIERLRPQFEAAGWTVSAQAALPYAHMQERLRSAGGLLLLCVSRAPIPSKLFDYLPTLRPILCVTPAGSALARAVEGAPQVVCVDPFDRGSFAERSAEFLRWCRSGAPVAAVPDRFSDETLSRVFLRALAEPGTE